MLQLHRAPGLQPEPAAAAASVAGSKGRAAKPAATDPSPHPRRAPPQQGAMPATQKGALATSPTRAPRPCLGSIHDGGTHANHHAVLNGGSVHRGPRPNRHPAANLGGQRLRGRRAGGRRALAAAATEQGRQQPGAVGQGRLGSGAGRSTRVAAASLAACCLLPAGCLLAGCRLSVPACQSHPRAPHLPRRVVLGHVDQHVVLHARLLADGHAVHVACGRGGRVAGCG